MNKGHLYQMPVTPHKQPSKPTEELTREQTLAQQVDLEEGSNNQGSKRQVVRPKLSG